MKWTTLLLLSASGMAASAALVWTAVDTASGARPAASVGAPRPADDRSPQRPVDDGSQFRADGTLQMEGRLGHAVLPAASDNQTYLFVSINAAAGRRVPAPAPLDLAIVMDRSGSMKGKRLANAVAAARSAVQRLRDGDTVSVVAYNTTADVLVSRTVIDAASRARLIDRIGRVRAAGDTCISCAVDAGMRTLGQRAGAVSRILLLSDGEATAGVRDVDGFRRVAEDCRRMGASITTIGVDVDYNERIMAALARGSNGRHFFVESPSGLPSIFDQEMNSLASTLASRAELTVDLSPSVQVEQVYDRNSVTSGSQLVVPLGSFAAGETKTLLARVRVPRGPAGKRPVAAVRLRYDDLTDGQAGRAEGTLVAQLTSDPRRVAPLDGQVSARLSSSEAAAALEQANELARAGRLDDARKLVRDKAGAIGEARRKARAVAPAARGPALDASFDRQASALDDAEKGFAQPPPTAAEPAAGGAAPAAESGDDGQDQGRRTKARIRSNQKDAFELGE
jgi:Ca-activated chloride channel family protein